VDFFKSKNYFGADPETLLFFQQSMLPLLSPEGKILMEAPHKLVMGPNGNGALFDAVNRNEEVKKVLQGIDYVQVIGVDNVLNRLLDPLYFGFTAQQDL
jgi:UDP-N-acetylglucosamine/UDP-N-acetylgalactosamine diphosphorylase